MIITTGKVLHGAIQIDPKELPDGTTVTVLAQEGDETFELAPQEEAKLIAAMGEATRGEAVSADQVVKNLRRS